MKDQKGITLIALVITIIVLLILAGVSIAMLTGDNGMLTKAVGAGEKSKVAEVNEAILLGLAEIQSNRLDPTYTNTTASETDVTDEISGANLQKAIEENNANIKNKNLEVTATGNAGSELTVTYKYDSDTTHTWTIDKDGKITDSPDILDKTTTTTPSSESDG